MESSTAGMDGRKPFFDSEWDRLELIGVLAGLAAFAPLSTDMYLPAFPQIERHFSTDGGSVQLSLSSFFAAFALGQLLFGPLSDRFGRRKPLYGGLLLFIVSSLACVVAPDISSLIALRFLQGLGACAGAVITMAVVRDVFEGKEASKAFALLAVVGGLAPMIAPTLGGFVLLLGGWKMVFYALAAIGSVCLLAMHFRLPETAPAKRLSVHPLAVAKAYLGVAKGSSFLLFTMGMGFAGAGMFAYISASPFVFIQGFGVEPWVFGLIFGGNVVGMICSAHLNGVLMRRFEPGEVLRVASVAQCCCGLLLLFMAAFKPGGLFGILIPLFGYLFFLGLSRPNGMVFIMAPYKDRAGTASALTGALQFLVAALAAMAMGLFHSATALPMAAVMAFFGLAAMTLNLLALRRVRTLPPDVPKEVDLGTKAGIDLLD